MPTDKFQPQVRILAYPLAATPRVDQAPFAWHDPIRGMLLRDHTEPTGNTSGEGLTGAFDQWSGQRAFDSVDPEIRYFEFGPTVGEGVTALISNSTPIADSQAALGVFTLRGRSFPKNCVMVDDGGVRAIPKGKAEFETVYFKAKRPSVPTGEHTKWETVLPWFGNGGTCVEYQSAIANRVAEVESVDEFPAGQQYRFTVEWIHRYQDHSTKAGFRIAVGGNQWSIAAREDAQNNVVFSLEQWDNRVHDWVPRRRFDDAKLKEFRGQSVITLERVAGRIVVGIDGHTYDFIATTEESAGVSAELRDANWRKGKINVYCFGVRARVGLELILATDAAGAPLAQAFSRTVPYKLKPGTEYTIETQVTGWQGNGAKMTVSSEAVETGIKYTVTLKASKNGVDAPAASIVAGRAQGHFNNGDATPIDVTRAFLTGSISEANPEQKTSGVTATAEFSRSLLHDINADWENYLKQFHLLKWEVRWMLKDGSFTPYIGRKFYIEDVRKSVQKVNDWRMSLSLRDETLLLTTGFGIVDSKYPKDLGWLFGRKNNGRGGDLYAGEIVQFILDTEMPGEGARINGNGDPLRFMSPGHYPMLSKSQDRTGYIAGAQVPTQSGAQLPVTWGAAPISEIYRLAEKDFSVFFYDNIPDGEGGVSAETYPIWADYRVWVNTFAPTHDINDGAVYEPRSLDFVIQAAETVQRGGRMPNRVLVWNTPPGFNASNFPLPAPMMAEERLDASDPNSVESTGILRTLKIDTALKHPFAAKALAILTIGRLRGLKVEWPELTIRGDMRIKWGHKVRIHMGKSGGNESSDLNIALDGREFRVIKVTHTFDKAKMGSAAFQTKLSLFPVQGGD